jgi:hypothetical protein
MIRRTLLLKEAISLYYIGYIGKRDGLSYDNTLTE